MLTIAAVAGWLERLAPARMAADWDNVGLLVGDRQSPVAKIMTCLTITPGSAAEAIAGEANLIVAHHPLPFRPLKRITADSTSGRMLLDLIAARVAIYSPHTSFDSAAGGVNQRLAEALDLVEIAPLVEEENGSNADGVQLPPGSGRQGRYRPPLALQDVAAKLKQFLKIDQLQAVGADDLPVAKVAVACGSGGEFLASARRIGCHCLVTGETNFHTALEAEACGIGLLLTGHYASERFAIEFLAERLAAEFPPTEVWASRQEADPHRWV